MSRLLLLLLLLASMPYGFAQETTVPLGSPENGALAQGVPLPLESAFHLKIIRGRQRWWGTRDLVQLILMTATQFHALWRQRLIVGDMSQYGGGDISRHRSHENGLDVDIGYPTRSGWEQDPEILTGFRRAMVDGRGRLHRDLNIEATWDLVKIFVSMGQVQRVFVAPEIKSQICRLARRIGEGDSAVLGRLTPLYNHRDHLHVRLYCPAGAANCENLEDPPSGTGCGV